MIHWPGGTDKWEGELSRYFLHISACPVEQRVPLRVTHEFWATFRISVRASTLETLETPSVVLCTSSCVVACFAAVTIHPSTQWDIRHPIPGVQWLSVQWKRRKKTNICLWLPPKPRRGHPINETPNQSARAFTFNFCLLAHKRHSLFLHSWDKTHWVVMCNFFYVLLGWFASWGGLHLYALPMLVSRFPFLQCLRFWYWGHVGLIKWAGECSPLFFFLLKFEKHWP